MIPSRWTYPEGVEGCANWIRCALLYFELGLNRMWRQMIAVWRWGGVCGVLMDDGERGTGAGQVRVVGLEQNVQ